MENAVNLYAKVNQEHLKNQAFKVTVPSTIPGDGLFKVLERLPVVWELHGSGFSRFILEIKEGLGAELIHANILEPRNAYLLANQARRLGIGLVLTIHSPVYLCPISYGVMLPEMSPCTMPSLKRHCMKCMVSLQKLEGESSLPSVRSNMELPYWSFGFGRLMREGEVISPSKYFARQLRSKLGVRVHAIPNPLDEAMLQQRPAHSGDGSVVFIGRLTYEKGIRYLPILAAGERDVEFHVIGTGRRRTVLEGTGLANLVLHGFVTEEEKSELISRASVVIVPSVWCEQGPYTAAEAFCFGKPVVAFDLGGQKELVEESGGGLLAKPFDIDDFAGKIRQILRDESGAQEMGRRGRKWVEDNLNPSLFARRLGEVYELAMA